MSTINWLGRTVVLNSLVAFGLVCSRLSVPWADHITLAALCVALIRIGKNDSPALGWRILALMVLLATGLVATCLHIDAGQIIALATSTVMLEILQADTKC